MIALARYARVNATLRALRPDILSTQDIENLLGARSLEEAWRVLEKTVYGEWIPPSSGRDVLEIEEHLHNATGHRFAKIPASLTGKPKAVGRLLLARWDLDALLGTLRLWHGKGTNPPRAPALDSFVNPLALDKVVQVSSLTEIAATLSETPYAMPILSALHTYTEKHTIFYVEIALEKDYYRRLLDATANLGGNDAREASLLIGVEIDLVNLACLMRLSHYHGIPADSLSEYVIGGPSELSRMLIQQGLTDDLLAAGQTRYLSPGQNGTQTRSPQEAILLMEGILSEKQIAQARKALMGFPFGIAPVLAFYILTRLALRNLRAIFAANVCGLDASSTRARLCGLE